jgi:hypothetical protein
MKHLWTNGDSHTAGSHFPTNITNTFARQVAENFNLEYTNIAEPAGSNQRIIRTTIEALPNLDPKDTILLLGWSSWERTEWYYDNQWYKICGDPGYDIPEFIHQRWQENNEYFQRHFVDQNAEQEIWRCAKEQEHAIWTFHQLLHNLGYKFLFFLACEYPFFQQQEHGGKINSKLPWLPNVWAHDPYQETGFSHHSKNQGFVKDQLWHYGQDAHDAWAQVLIPQVNAFFQQP